MYIKNKNIYWIHMTLCFVICIFFLYVFSVEKKYIHLIFMFVSILNLGKYVLKYKNFEQLEEKDKTIL